MAFSIKEHPELRHALAHMFYAIRALAQRDRAVANYELDSVESHIFWETDEHMSQHVEGMNYGKAKSEVEVLQGQVQKMHRQIKKLQRKVEELQG